jgi:hypothetical protein
MMKSITIILFMLCLGSGACNPGNENDPHPVNTTDTLIEKNDLPVPADTDNYNVPGPSVITLDSPVGPHDPTDTAGKNRKNK